MNFGSPHLDAAGTGGGVGGGGLWGARVFVRFSGVGGRRVRAEERYGSSGVAGRNGLGYGRSLVGTIGLIVVLSLFSYLFDWSFIMCEFNKIGFLDFSHLILLL